MVNRLLLFVLCIISAPLPADVPESQKPEVQHLLDFVGQTDCLMIRNGSEHDGKKAVSHIQTKYDYFRDDIKSTEDFIEYSATKSTMSGKYYTVKCPGREEIRSQDWLLEELGKFRKQRGQE